MRAEWNGAVLGESDRTIELGGYHYFPRDAVRMELMRPAPQTPNDLECPHGVRFFDVVTDEGEGVRLAWTYETPEPSHQAIDHWIGFWKEVELVTPGRD
jgi:uncharacterized protein (DUF427 family)